MECYYHPDTESVGECTICGKSICQDCGMEIGKKFYCKDCLEKIIGLERKEEEIESPAPQEPAKVDPPKSDDNVYQPQNEDIGFEEPYSPQEEIPSRQGFSGVSEDSPYNIKGNIKYSGGLESSYMDEPYQKTEQEPQITQNEIDSNEQAPVQSDDVEYVYPDQDAELQEADAGQSLEDKYEKYLDDLYFDEVDIPLNEQLAKDEAQYGSLTKKEYEPRKKEAAEQVAPGEKQAPKVETAEEMEARIRAEILKEQEKSNKKGLLRNRKKNKEVPEEVEEEDINIHNLNYQDENESLGIIDIILTIILIIVILIVLYYIVYLFMLSSTYPTFLDAIVALKNPQNIINALRI